MYVGMVVFLDECRYGKTKADNPIPPRRNLKAPFFHSEKGIGKQQ
jgi:hypothetical protein